MTEAVRRMWVEVLLVADAVALATLPVFEELPSSEAQTEERWLFLKEAVEEGTASKISHSVYCLTWEEEEEPEEG